MKYKEEFQKYLDGELAQEDKERIERDLERHSVLTGFMDSKLDEFLFEEESPEEEKEQTKEQIAFHKAVTKAVNRKMRSYSMAAGAIVLAVVLFLMYGLSPLLDRIYYDPTKLVTVKEKDGTNHTYNEYPTQMTVFSELYLGARGKFDSEQSRTFEEGYGTYSMIFATETLEGMDYKYYTLKRNKLIPFTFQNEYWVSLWNNELNEEDFAFYEKEGEQNYAGKSGQNLLDEIENLRDGERVRAALSFPDVKNMDEALEFMEKYEGEYLYLPIELIDTTGERYESIGMVGLTPEKGKTDLTYSYDWEKYPYLDLNQCKEGDLTGEMLEQHMNSMVNYLVDQKKFLRAFENDMYGMPMLHPEPEVLKSLLKNSGVNAYGAVVWMTKEQLQKVASENAAAGVHILE